VTDAQKSVQNVTPRLISSAPEGLDALWLARLFEAAETTVHLHVARDDARMEQFVECFGFFAPEVPVETFPAWDCLPYDRVGPRLDILARRSDLLSRLSSDHASATRLLVVTTVNALLQRVPPAAAFEGLRRDLVPGATIDPAKLIEHLGQCGYQRIETVSEPGEYAPRGGIVDLFPPQSQEPLRLDFFGDELESIRRFDPVTQRTSENTDQAVIGPVGEVFLTAETIERFRSGYREAFGSGRDDPLYESVSAGRHHQGMEHWLPLFYETLEPLFSYLPADVGLTLDHQAAEAVETRFETIEDFFEASSRPGAFTAKRRGRAAGPTVRWSRTAFICRATSGRNRLRRTRACSSRPLPRRPAPTRWRRAAAVRASTSPMCVPTRTPIFSTRSRNGWTHSPGAVSGSSSRLTAPARSSACERS
jgi:transcription-repair coupling factor (superfamily II helicase)